MYGIFTYIYHILPLKTTKCRQIYHTWMVWVLDQIPREIRKFQRHHSHKKPLIRMGMVWEAGHGKGPPHFWGVPEKIPNMVSL